MTHESVMAQARRLERAGDPMAALMLLGDLLHQDACGPEELQSAGRLAGRLLAEFLEHLHGDPHRAVGRAIGDVHLAAAAGPLRLFVDHVRQQLEAHPVLSAQRQAQ